MTIFWQFEKTSREATAGVHPPPGSRDAGTQYNPHVSNVIRLPVRSSLGPANLPPLPAALYSRGVPLEASDARQSTLDVIAVSLWLAYFALWGGTLFGLVVLLFL